MLLLFAAGAAAENQQQAGAPLHVEDVLILSGKVVDVHGNGVRDAIVSISIDGDPVSGTAITSQDDGVFETRLRFSAGALQSGRLEATTDRRAYESRRTTQLLHPLVEHTGSQGEQYYLAHLDVVLERAISPSLWIAGIVLLGVYLLIAFEIIHRTLAAMVGASVLLFVSYTVGTVDEGYRIITFGEAMEAIDHNVIFLLMAMMLIVGVLKRTGVFQWLAYQSFRMARGNIFVLALFLMLITALTSAFLDNVTTMLLVVPVSIEIATALRIRPLALLMPEVFASNVGGTATLIGDPPNIMIGSFAGLSFTDFLVHLAPLCLILLFASAIYFLVYYRAAYRDAEVASVPKVIERLRREYRITDQALLLKSVLVLLLVITLFVFHGALEMAPSIAAMAGASLLLVISGVRLGEMVEQEVEWPTLVFFMMLFVVVASAEQAGLIEIVANWVREASEGSPLIAVLLVLWVSAICSGLVDNIPFTATMMPVVAYLTATVPGVENGVLWWALALGACLGGNGTLVGASANVVTAGLADKAGHPISFVQYLRVALVPTLLTVALAGAWLVAFEM